MARGPGRAARTVGRAVRVAAALVVGAGLITLAAAPALAARRPEPGVGFRSAQVATGNDISFPQCGAPFPSGQAFGIVGVNDGLANTLNPCLGPSTAHPSLLQSELYWAAADSTGGGGQPGASLYVNTADPGNSYGGTPIADWPRSGTTPDGTCTTVTGASLGQDSLACAYAYGLQKATQDARWLSQAAQAIDAAAPPTPVPTQAAAYPWWLDVETANTWQSGANGLAMNRADLMGMVAGLEHAGATTIGIHSTGVQWDQITGGTAPALGSLAGLPDWIPGASSAAAAEANCALTPFTGGPVVLTEWLGQPYDGDVACPLGAPTGVQAAPAAGQVTLSWSAPADGGSPITGYVVTAMDSTTGASPPPVVVQGSPPATSATVVGLIAGDAYAFTVTASTAIGSGAPSSALTVTTPAPYHPAVAARLCDTRPTAQPPNQCSGRTLAAGSTLTVQVAGYTPPGAAAAPVPLGATAVVLAVTATDGTATSFLTVYPAGTPPPLASNLNWNAGETVTDAVTVPLSPTGAVDVANAVGEVAVVVDLEGYFGPASAASAGVGFAAATPTRICDTRPAVQPADQCSGRTLTAGVPLSVQVAGYSPPGSSVAPVPPGAAAVVLNVTAIAPAQGSYLTVWPAGSPQPLASDLTWAAGATRAARVVVPLSGAGAVDLAVGAGTAAMAIDVAGYFSASGSGLFEPVIPQRVCDTREAAPPTPCAGRVLQAGTDLTLQVAGSGNVPLLASAAVATVTVTNTTRGSYLTVWPAGSARPTTSDLDWRAGETVPNLLIAGLGTGGQLNLTAAAGSAAVIVDIAGWFT